MLNRTKIRNDNIDRISKKILALRANTDNERLAMICDLLTGEICDLHVVIADLQWKIERLDNQIGMSKSRRFS